jgi:DNA-binding transcriptional LysR family regulator
MDVELRLMRYVIAVAEEGGFTAAAARLHMAQPPLSRQIRDLERRLGTQLFERRPVRLTPAGGVFVKGARPILAHAERMVRDTRLAAVGEVGLVRIGYVLSAAYETVPALLEELARLHPHIRVEAREAWSAELEHSVDTGGIDLAIAHTIPARPDFEQLPLRRESLVAVVAANHRLAGRSAIALEDLAGDTFAFYDPELAPAHYRLLVEVLRTAGTDFPQRTDLLPGLRNLRLPDARSFTLVPASMAGGLPASAHALCLSDAGLPYVETSIVFNRSEASPVARLTAELGGELAANRGWLD